MNQTLPPGPHDRFFGLTTVRRLQREPLPLLDELATRYGALCAFRAGPYQLVFVNDHELVREVLVTQHKSFRKDPRLVRKLGEIDGRGLVLTEGDFWLRQRRLVQPAFHARRMPAYAKITVDHALRLFESWKPGQTIDAVAANTRLTLEIIAELLFGVSLTEDVDQLGRAVSEVSAFVTRENGAVVPLPDWLPLPSKRRKRMAIATLDRFIRGLIVQRRAQPRDHGDLLSMLLAAVDTEGDGAGMSDEQVRDEAMTLFNAGHDSTAAALVWLWHLLTENPGVQSRLVSEVDDVLAGRAPTFEDLPRLVYTEMVVKESLRIFPPTWILISREALVDVRLGEYTIRRGSLVFVSPWMLHHNPRYFPDAQRFDPERFSPQRASAIPQYAYLPFGGGPHICIGNSLATMEMMLIVACLMQRFCLASAPGQGPVVPEAQIAIRPRGGLRIVLAPRAPKSQNAFSPSARS